MVTSVELLCHPEKASSTAGFFRSTNQDREGDLVCVYEGCELCPRRCRVDRRVKRGFCGEGVKMRLAACVYHRGEEPPLVGGTGAGTFFFTGCTLGCPFCQNHQISSGGVGWEVSEDEFASLCLEFQEGGASCINLVTATHFIPSVVEGLSRARDQGLRLPVVWNSSGYEREESLELLFPHVSVFLPDLKTLDRGIAVDVFGSPDYPEVAERAVRAMIRRRPLVWDGDRLLQGVIVRHLVLPGALEATERVLAWWKEHAEGRAILSLMVQYDPAGKATDTGASFPLPLTRRLTVREYEEVLRMLEEYEVDEGFLQEYPEGPSLVPDFTRESPFDPDLAVPLEGWLRIRSRFP
ncbi:radical SAM domain protein [Spirochaeta thermophila DSM 6192]|uniref:Radical SAM domain protein n=1 Tax=Winmispira thermophila (strain ATCC 49972 / DSM 6192 / RI 19.B1) TaxID=665571 RepID=E0RR82_WINT6|nr:radical SAM domain protein [Spirochaeta thermophila DSM 6192]